MEMIALPGGGLDHDKLAKKLEQDVQILMKNGRLSEGTRNLMNGLASMPIEKRHKALEVLLAGKRRVGGSTAIDAHVKAPDPCPFPRRRRKPFRG